MAKLKGTDHLMQRSRPLATSTQITKLQIMNKILKKNVIIWQFLFLDFSINAQGFCNNGGLMIPNGLMLQPL